MPSAGEALPTVRPALASAPRAARQVRGAASRGGLAEPGDEERGSGALVVAIALGQEPGHVEELGVEGASADELGDVAGDHRELVVGLLDREGHGLAPGAALQLRRQLARDLSQRHAIAGDQRDRLQGRRGLRLSHRLRARASLARLLSLSASCGQEQEPQRMAPPSTDHWQSSVHDVLLMNVWFLSADTAHRGRRGLRRHTGRADGAAVQLSASLVRDVAPCPRGRRRGAELSGAVAGQRIERGGMPEAPKGQAAGSGSQRRLMASWRASCLRSRRGTTAQLGERSVCSRGSGRD